MSCSADCDDSVYKQMEFTSQHDKNQVKANYSVEIHINDYTVAYSSAVN
jgi:hypothetical protein